jgi:tetratricopeptide (TPR) repeat protein
MLSEGGALPQQRDRCAVVSWFSKFSKFVSSLASKWTSSRGSRSSGNVEAIVRQFAFWFMLVGFTGLIFAGVAASNCATDGLGPLTLSMHPEIKLGLQNATCISGRTSGFRVFALGLMLAGACTCTGWLFGLLFGVPRAVAQATNNNAAAAAASTSSTANNRTSPTKVNTNLEDISDWLTKTLVGVGLVELQSLPRFLGDLAFAANAYGFGWADHGQLLALSIILYFVPGGFWLGYVNTRTLLTRLFNLFDGGAWQAHVNVAALADNLEVDGLNEIRPAKGAVMVSDAAVLSQPLQTLDEEDEIVAWAAAQARAGNVLAACAALENVLGSNPANDVATRQLVKIYISLGRIPPALALAKQLPDDAPPKVLAALYEPQPDGYKKAIKLGEPLVEVGASCEQSSSVHIWLACAYAQEYDYADKHGQGDEKQAARVGAITHITKAIDLDPDKARDAMVKLMYPSDDSIDNDLSVFQGDVEIEKLLPDPEPKLKAQPQ